MDSLRRVLYLQAALLFLAGTALAVAPTAVVPHLFGTPAELVAEPAWVRIAGVEAIGLSMLHVLVAHRVEQLWWWAWGFAVTTVGLAAVVLLNAAFGLSGMESKLAWWLFAIVLVGLSFGLLYGLFVSSREQPLP